MRSKAPFAALALASVALIIFAGSTVLAAGPAAAHTAVAPLAHQVATLNRLNALTPKLAARVGGHSDRPAPYPGPHSS